MFDQTLALVDDCGLTYLHVFPFSARPGTPAAKMPPVAAASVKERAKRLREAGNAALRRHHAAQIGTVLRVLTERGGMGRAEDFTLVKTDDAPPSLMINVAIEKDEGRALGGHILRRAWGPDIAELAPTATLCT